jgi:hypothetical protein
MEGGPKKPYRFDREKGNLDGTPHRCRIAKAHPLHFKPGELTTFAVLAVVCSRGFDSRWPIVQQT